MSFRIAGHYLEVCNCEAICPCRRINGVPGGRSTHGVCFGALTWRVDEGNADGVDLSGSGAVMTYSYDDDEPGSPWTLVLHVDGPPELRRGGEHVLELPWVRKPTTSIEMRAAAIEFGAGDIRVGGEIHVRATERYRTDATVSCIVPGHDSFGTELVNDEVVVDDGGFSFELHGTCGFERDFDYTG